MSLRFFRRLPIGRGVTLNLSKSGGSLSFGPRGAKVTVGPRGLRGTAGLTGTGLFYTKHKSWKSMGTGATGAKSRRPAQDEPEHPPLDIDDPTLADPMFNLPSAPGVEPESRLTLGFFQRLWISKGEEGFVDGLREVLKGDDQAGLRLLRHAADQADGAFMAGLIALRLELLDQAVEHLSSCLRRQRSLGRLFEKYGVAAAADMWLTAEVRVLIGADVTGVRVARAEAHQQAGRWGKALEDLRALQRDMPDDPIVKLAIIEILVEDAAHTQALKEAVKVGGGVVNDSPIHAAILLYQGVALAQLGLLTAAREALAEGLRRKADRPPELRRRLRYELALVDETLGQPARARRTLEKLYAEDPSYADVAERLGLG